MQVNNVSFTGLYKAVPHKQAIVYDKRVKSNVEARVFEYKPFKDETDSQIASRKSRYNEKIFEDRRKKLEAAESAKNYINDYSKL